MLFVSGLLIVPSCVHSVAVPTLQTTLQGREQSCCVRTSIFRDTAAPRRDSGCSLYSLGLSTPPGLVPTNRNAATIMSVYALFLFPHLNP